MRGAFRGRGKAPFLGLLAIGVLGCGGNSTPGAWKEWERIPVHSAEFFQLWQHEQARLLLTFGPGGTTDTTGIFIVGHDQLSAGKGSKAVVFKQPLDRVALLSTTHASFISALDRADAVVGCAYTDRLRDPLVIAMAQAGRLVEIASAEGVDRERILMLAPDALFTYPYGSEGSANLPGQLPMIPIAEYLEKHPLGRAEWIRAFGVLFGKEPLADSLYAGIVHRYEETRASVPRSAVAPDVFFGSAWKGTWSVPAGNSYMARLITDAGGHYLFADHEAPGNLDLDLEMVLQVGAKAEFWGRILDQQTSVKEADVAGSDSRVMALPAFTQGGCFYANSATSDLFGQAGLEPEMVLKDLIDIFHPAQAGDRKPVYFKPVQ